MTKWETDIRAPAGTPRFYGVRRCRRCGEEEAKHPAGHFLGNLERKCRAAPAAKGETKENDRG
jgi:hypothetical protein